MRTKIALLFGVMALVAASAAPAAQGKVVSVTSPGPLAVGQTFQAYSTNLILTTAIGSFGCKWGNPPLQGEAITTKVVKNKADPAVLDGFTGPSPCVVNGTEPIPGSSEATGPVELFGNGTGKLPIKFNLYFSNGSQLCAYAGVLNLTPQAGSNTAKVSGFVWAPGCGPAEVNANLYFHLANGTPVTFVYS